MKLVPGLHEALITRALKDEIQRAKNFETEREPVATEAAPKPLGRYLFDALVRALRNLPEEHRAKRQIELANELVDLLAKASPNSGVDDTRGRASLAWSASTEAIGLLGDQSRRRDGGRRLADCRRERLKWNAILGKGAQSDDCEVGQWRRKRAPQSR